MKKFILISLVMMSVVNALTFKFMSIGDEIVEKGMEKGICFEFFMYMSIAEDCRFNDFCILYRFDKKAADSIILFKNLKNIREVKEECWKILK